MAVLPYFVDRGRPNLSPDQLALLEPLYDYRQIGTGDAMEFVLNETPYTYVKQLGDNWLAFYSPTGEYQGDDLQTTHRGGFREFFRELATGVSIVGGAAFAIGGANAASVIGKAITGESFTAAYPAISRAIGSAAITTAGNGGNFELTVKNLAASYAGSVGGGYANILTNSPLIGAVTSSALTAAAMGSDINTAVRNTLINYGIQNMDDILKLPPVYEGGPSPINSVYLDDPVIDYYDVGSVVDFGGFLPQGGDNMLFDTQNVLDQIYTTAAFPYDNSWDDYGGGGGIDTYVPDLQDLPPYQYSIPDLPPVDIPGVIINQNTPQPAPSSGGNFLSNVTAAMMAALQLVRAYQQTQAPIRNNPTTVTTQGVRRVNSNGTITTTAPNGRVSTTRPQVGVPETTVDGGLVVNNGDGTYTFIDATGQRYIRNYPATTAGNSGGGVTSIGGGMSNNTLLIAGGLGIAALLLLKKK